MTNNYFPSNLRFLRKAHKLSQKELAAKVDKVPSLISMWESGLRDPILDDVRLIADYFNIALSDIIATDLSMSYSTTNININEVITMFKQLDANQQKIVYDLMKSMVK